MNITHRWKRFFAVGCSHGHLANPRSIAWALKLKKEIDPHLTLHLGDFIDLAAFRSGAGQGKDSAESVKKDFKEGIKFLNQLHPQIIHIGNHEHRVYELLDHPNAVASFAAQGVVSDLNDVAKDLGAKIMPYDMWKGWTTLGNFKFGHGFMFSENAIRDHAETFGNCVIAHLHRPGNSTGRRDDTPEAFCSGTLADIPAMGYASKRRATLSWGAGAIHGEYCEKYCHVQLSRFYEKEDKLD